MGEKQYQPFQLLFNASLKIAFLIVSLMVLSATGAYAQPTNGPAYWSSSPPDCSALSETAVAITNSSGATVGYSCYVTGTFIWFAAGGPWNSYIRVAASGYGAIGIDYTFYDNSGNNVSLDTAAGASRFSGNEAQFALTAHQPLELHLVGPTSGAPGYSSTATGSVYAVFYCPSAAACEVLQPQLFYSALPGFAWTMAAPISWDGTAWTQWAGEGVDDGGGQRVSFVIYNQGTTATSFQIRVFDSNGNLVGSGTTPQIPGLPVFSDGSYGEGGTYGALLSQVVTTPLPSGIFKVLIDGGTEDCSVEILQFTGASATTLQVSYDTSAGVPTAVTGAVKATSRALRMRPAPHPKGIFPQVPR
jgi:hypothetical protein